jgi:spore coat polysaccharide biosynthesis protein SpsF (cytidylyltransferase family)
MNDIIEQYYENFNYPSVDKLYKLLKDDNHDVKKKDVKDFLDKQEEAQILKETKKVSLN